MAKFAAEGRFQIVFTATDTEEAERLREVLVARMVDAIGDGVLIRESSIGSVLRTISDDKQLSIMDLPENAGDTV